MDSPHAALLADRAVTRRLLGAVVQAIDAGTAMTTEALPPLDGLDPQLLADLPAALLELPALRDRLLTRGALLDAQVRAARDELHQQAAAADRAGMHADLAALLSGALRIPQADVAAILATEQSDEARAAALQAKATGQVDLGALACSPHRLALVDALEGRDREAQLRLAFAGAVACEAAGAAPRCPCRMASWCAMERAGEIRAGAIANMREAGKPGAVPERQAKLVRRHLRWTPDRRPLKPLPALQVARAFLARKPMTLTPDACRVPVPGGIASLGDPVEITGDQWCLVFYSATGLGKSVSAAYLIARLGGVYLPSYDLLRVGFDADVPTRDQLRVAPLVVVDQLGREPRGATDHGPGMIEWLIEARYSADRPLVLIGNFAQPQQLVEHYGREGAGAIMGSRLAEGTCWARLTGPDLRTVGAW